MHRRAAISVILVAELPYPAYSALHDWLSLEIRFYAATQEGLAALPLHAHPWA